jgi:prephenate dehydrogenase
VLGLGSLGGSLALALRRTSSFGEVIGWDPDFDTARGAQRHKVADRFVKTAPEAARPAALVFVALRGDTLGETLTAIGPHLRPGAVACSLLEPHELAQAAATRALPGNVSFISVDAVPWKAVVGGDGGSVPSPDRFQDGLWCVSPAPSAHSDAVAYVIQIGERMGMRAFFAGPREHDALAAGLQQLPGVLAAALLHVAIRQSSWRELSRLAGAEFRDATVPVASDSDERQAALSGNREHVVRWLEQLGEELATLRGALAGGHEPADYFASAHAARARWLAERDLPADTAELPRAELPRRRFPF